MIALHNTKWHQNLNRAQTRRPRRRNVADPGKSRDGLLQATASPKTSEKKHADNLDRHSNTNFAGQFVDIALILRLGSAADVHEEKKMDQTAGSQLKAVWSRPRSVVLSEIKNSDALSSPPSQVVNIVLGRSGLDVGAVARGILGQGTSDEQGGHQQCSGTHSFRAKA